MFRHRGNIIRLTSSLNHCPLVLTKPVIGVRRKLVNARAFDLPAIFGKPVKMAIICNINYKIYLYKNFTNKKFI